MLLVFLDVGLNISFRCVFCWMPMLNEYLVGNVVLYTKFSLLAGLVGVTSSVNTLVEVL